MDDSVAEVLGLEARHIDLHESFALAAAGKVVHDEETGNTRWTATGIATHQSVQGQATQPTDPISEIENIVFLDAAAGALADGASLNFVEFGPVRIAATFIPAGHAVRVPAVQEDGSVSLLREQPYILISGAWGMSDAVSKESATIGATRATALAKTLVSFHDPDAPTQIHVGPGVLSDNPIRDRFLAEADISTEELPPIIASLIFNGAPKP